MDLYFEMYVIYWFFCGIDVFLNIVVSHDYLLGTFLDFLRNSIYYLIKKNLKKKVYYIPVFKSLISSNIHYCVTHI